MSNLLRPDNFDNIIGQEEIINNLKISVTSARKRGDVLQHCLFYGNAGLGKTTIARALANELDIDMQIANGASLSTNRDVLPYLMKLKEGSILFIDEIHRVNKKVQEYLLTVIEDFRLDIVIPAGKKDFGETITIDLPKFCLVGATTEMGDLVQPFLDRFKLKHFMRFYSSDELLLMLKGNSLKLKVDVSEAGLNVIAKASRGTPRIANSLLEWVRDYQTANDLQGLEKEQVTTAIKMQGIDENGLNPIDRDYLSVLEKLSKESPVGVNTLCSALSLDKNTIEQKIEPWLIQQGYISKTPKGRIIVEKDKKDAPTLADFFT
jgi:Holliday junction DNA helicase RuvB